MSIYSDEVGDYFFWLDIEMGHVCWAKRPSDRHKPDAHYHAPLIEVHGEPSNVLESHPGFDADGKHRFSFWLTAGDNRLDLVAHSEIHYNAWVQGAEKFLLFGPVGLNPSLAFLTSPQKGVTQGWTGHSLVGKLMNSDCLIFRTTTSGPWYYVVKDWNIGNRHISDICCRQLQFQSSRYN
jgi:hypothetical protein